MDRLIAPSCSVVVLQLQSHKLTHVVPQAHRRAVAQADVGKHRLTLGSIDILVAHVRAVRAESFGKLRVEARRVEADVVWGRRSECSDIRVDEQVARAGERQSGVHVDARISIDDQLPRKQAWDKGQRELQWGAIQGGAEQCDDMCSAVGIAARERGAK